MAHVSTCLNHIPYFGGPDYNSKILWIPDSNFELLPVQSPLLRQSLLISSPPLSNMLKSSGSSYLISGAIKSVCFRTAHSKVTAAGSIYFMRELLSHLVGLVVCAHWNKYAGRASTSCVQRSDDSWFCNSHCISHSCCVLHRYGSQDIHRWKFKLLSTIDWVMVLFE